MKKRLVLALIFILIWPMLDLNVWVVNRRSFLYQLYCKCFKSGEVVQLLPEADRDLNALSVFLLLIVGFCIIFLLYFIYSACFCFFLAAELARLRLSPEPASRRKKQMTRFIIL